MKIGVISTALAFLLMAVPLTAVAGPTTDGDGDGVPDLIDNCTGATNWAGSGTAPREQIDTDRDGWGNACDGDYNQTGGVNVQDFLVLAQTFGKSAGDAGYNANVDCNNTDSVNVQDFLCLAAAFGFAQGPSGLACAGGPDELSGRSTCDWDPDPTRSNVND